MKQKKHINDIDQNDLSMNSDVFDTDSIILIRLNSVPDNLKTNDYIKVEECNIVDEFVILKRKEVFKAIYDIGKELYEKVVIRIKANNLGIDFLDAYNTNTGVQAIYKVVFNEYVKENGYPYLIEKLPHIKELHTVPMATQFLQQCTIIYVIEELRKWIYKIRNGLNKGYRIKKNGSIITTPTYKMKKLLNLIKEEIAVYTEYLGPTIFYDSFTKEEAIAILNQEWSTDNKELNKEEERQLKKYLQVLQRCLIHYILKTMDTFKIQNDITKRLPIYNTFSNQYRLYTIANSQMGIALDYLLFNLTASQKSDNRVMCEFPDCNNEFERIGKSKFCSNHTTKEIRAYIKHKSYIKNKDKTN